MRAPSFHAEYNPDLFYFLPAVCWMRAEFEDGKPAGTVLQFLFLNFTAQWHWD